MSYEVEVSEGSTATRIGLGVRCPKCQQMVPATGLPVYMTYITDKGERRLIQGVMCIRPNLRHEAACSLESQVP
jgi:hypothetical protein